MSKAPPFGQMSRPGGKISTTQKPLSEPLPDRFTSAMDFHDDKPDSNEFIDLGSPISPLRSLNPSAAITYSSSSSSGSLSGRHSLKGSEEVAMSRPGHRQSGSGPLIYSSSSSNNSASSNVSNVNVLPAGNICPSGKLGKAVMTPRVSPRRDVLGSGTGNYGHGSIMRGGIGGRTGKEAIEIGDDAVRRAMVSPDPEEVTRVGNELYKQREFAEALKLYDRAIGMCKDNAACRSNRAAALTGLGRVMEAVKEYEEAIRIDSSNGRAHQRLASLLLRLGYVKNARKHLDLAGVHGDPAELQKLQTLERHLGKYEDFRKRFEWKSGLREADAAIAAGADLSHLVISLRAEALLQLHQLEEADSTLSNAPKLETTSLPGLQTYCCGMMSDSYIYIVHAQVEMALGRFENAVAAASKASQIDPRNGEVDTILHNVKSVAEARARGNEMFKSGNFDEACLAYGKGLKYDPLNPILHCNRAACYSKLGQWERSVEDCNEALQIHPNYMKAVLRRAASNAKLERWAESVRDYEILRKELPEDTEVAEALFHAQVALKTSRGEDVSGMKFGGEVEKIRSRQQFKAAISSLGVSVVYFMDEMDPQCTKTTQFLNSLCSKNPSLNFLKVNIKENIDVARDENVIAVPTFKVYKNGRKVKELIRPSDQMLEYTVRHYGT